MTKNSALHKLTPAGYLILQRSEGARLSNEYRRHFGQYSGVDRLPALFPPDEGIRHAIGVSPVEDARLGRIIEEWFDSQFGDTAFIPSRCQALRLLEAFQGFGFQFELVYCQLAWKEGEEARVNAYGGINDPSPDIAQTYGFDVSWPTCNHSAILQPGIVPSAISWRERLNEYGLLKEYEDAAKLRNEYLVIYPYPPFDIYLVERIE